MADSANEETKSPTEKAKEKADENSATNTQSWVDQLISGLSAGMGLVMTGYDYWSGNKDARADKDREAQLILATQQQQTTKTIITSVAVIGAILALILIFKK